MATFTYNGTVIQTDTIITSGYYDITVNGAQGGGDSQTGVSGGLGASATARVYLTSGTVLDILVGGQGVGGAGSESGGGGGGSFVVEEQPTANLALVVGGGGGGAGHSGLNGGDGGLAGTSDQGGGSSAFGGGGGGGGFASNGANGPNEGGTGGGSFESGGAGGIGFGNSAGYTVGDGGFGGGGGGGFSGGGGGGYGGGAAGSDDYITPENSGFGGTSYVTSSAISDLVNGGIESGDGLVTINAVCYAQGTAMLTDRGYRPVETLAIGDSVVTASGAVRPIRWIGHRAVDCRRVPAVEAQPIRIAAQAFGPERPARDLLVSPGHAICVDLLGEFFIPAHALVNGSTIVQMDVETVTYWHVELDSHDILLAENLPCESYCDHGNRTFFVEAGVVSLAARPDAEWEADAPPPFCRPFHESGLLVEAARAQLRRRAEAMGWRIEPSALAGFHALVGDRRIDPQLDGLVARFVLPPGAHDVWLIAPTARPFDVSESLDKRDLGVRVRRLSLDGVEIALDDSRLDIGFYDVERDWRWTSRRTKLPKSLVSASGERTLKVELCAPPLPRWRLPATSTASLAPELLTA